MHHTTKTRQRESSLWQTTSRPYASLEPGDNAVTNATHQTQHTDCSRLARCNVAAEETSRAMVFQAQRLAYVGQCREPERPWTLYSGAGLAGQQWAGTKVPPPPSAGVNSCHFYQHWHHTQPPNAQTSPQLEPTVAPEVRMSCHSMLSPTKISSKKTV